MIKMAIDGRESRRVGVYTRVREGDAYINFFIDFISIDIHAL